MTTADIPGTRPVVSADVVAVTMEDGIPVVATYTRRWDPYINSRALPGVMISEDETVAQACSRALTDKIGISIYESVSLQLPFRDALARDERSRTISLPQLMILDYPWDLSAHGAKWVPITDPGELAFDHTEILESGKKTLRENLLTTPGVARTLFGPQVSAKEVSDLLESLGAEPDKNLSRRLDSSPVTMKTDDTLSYGTGRPRKLWNLPKETP